MWTLRLGAGEDLPEVIWQQGRDGNPGLLTVGQPGVGRLHQPVPSHDSAGIWCGGCLESPKAVPTPGYYWPTEGFCWCPWAWHPCADAKGKAAGANSVPPEACTHSPHRLRQQPAVLGRPPLPAPSYLNISVTSPLASATRTGKPIHAGTRYRRAGCERTKAGEAMLGRAPAQGRAHHPNSLLGVTQRQVQEASQCLGLHWGS